MQIGSGSHSYDWVEGWGKLPPAESARQGWAHPGVAVSESGRVYTFHPGDPAIVVFDAAGNLIEAVPCALTDGHGITLVKEGDQEFLWVADNGAKRKPAAGYGYVASDGPPPGSARRPQDGEVVKLDLQGKIVATLERPDLPAYAEGKYSPTSVAVDEPRFGGSGDVWVADGYGQNRVHRYDRHGRYLSSISGEEGTAGAFKTPHGVWIDRRGREARLYVADRSNHRVQVYDLEGRFVRCFGEQFLSSPSAFAGDGDLLVVGELRARLALLDAADNLICYLADNEAVCTTPGWPNGRDEALPHVPTRRADLTPGKLNSPHGLGADAAGNLYVAEWLIGGRYTKLVKR